MDESILFFSQNSLWKLSTFRGYKGYLYWSENGMRRVKFFKTELAGGLASRLDWVASSSCELTERQGWTFCPVVLQLSWLFIFSACFTRVLQLAAYQSQVTRESQPWVSASLHNLEHFFILSHSLSLHESHLNTRLLITKIQINLTRNKANRLVDKIQPYNLYFHINFLLVHFHLSCIPSKFFITKKGQYYLSLHLPPICLSFGGFFLYCFNYFLFPPLMVLFVTIDLIVISHLFIFLGNLNGFLCIF